MDEVGGDACFFLFEDKTEVSGQPQRGRQVLKLLIYYQPATLVPRHQQVFRRD